MEEKTKLLYQNDDFLRGLDKVVEGLNLMIGYKGLAKYTQVHIGRPEEFEGYVEELVRLINKSKEPKD